MKKRILSFLLAVMLLVVPQTVFAADNVEYPVAPCWTYIYRISTSLSVNGHVVGEARMESYDDFTLIVELQEMTSSGWDEVETWSEDFNFSGSISEYYDLEDGVTYRVKTTVKVYNSSNVLVETASAYSETV